MGKMLSQAEIDALLSGEPRKEKTDMEGVLPQDIEVFKSVEYQGIQAAQTAMGTILGQNTAITIDNIEITTWEQLAAEHNTNQAVTRFDFKGGVKGVNLILIAGDIAKKIIYSMTGEKLADTNVSLSEFDLGVLGEIMNQAAGSFVTAVSAFINNNISMSPTDVSEYVLGTASDVYSDSDGIVKISCTLKIESICNDYLLHLVPLSMVKDIIGLKQAVNNRKTDVVKDKEIMTQAAPKSVNDNSQPKENLLQGKVGRNNMEVGSPSRNMHVVENVNVQPAKFQLFDNDISQIIEKKNLNLIMDVPLQITVELGRTQKLIRNILEYGPGSVIELDKLAGDPVDILVNGKSIAKGEVVVIDESFGVRITDIVDPSKRL